MIYGVDVSAYQPNFDFAACRREGFDFAIIKATEGTGWRSTYYRDQMARARAVGLLVAAYHYVRGSDVNGQLANIRSMVSTDTPVILDVEDGAGSIQSIRDLNAALNRAGYRTPLIYIPRWYWSGVMGSPDLRGLPPNWHSRYPDNVVRRKEGFHLGPEYWPTFGGLPTAVAQFTSSLAVANYPNGRIDGNAYRGTREELAALFNGQEDDVSAEDVLYGVKFGKYGHEYKAPLTDWILGIDEHTNTLRYQEIPALRALMEQTLAAVTNDPDITPEALKSVVDEATSKAAREQAELVVASINSGIASLVEEALSKVQGADNAQEIEELLRRIATLANPTPQEQS